MLRSDLTGSERRRTITSLWVVGRRPPPVTERDGKTRPAGKAVTYPRLMVVAAVAATILPSLLFVPVYAGHIDAYPASGDHALTELQVRSIANHPVLLGAFSREGWHHPGPALFYLLFIPYHLLGQSSATLPLVALTVNALCIVAIFLLVAGRLGQPNALLVLSILALYLRGFAPGFWRDIWNPTVAVLPFAVMVLLCWCYLERAHLSAMPAAVGLGSFCVQCHVGFLLPVTAALSSTVVYLLVASRGRWRSVISRHWLSGLVSVLVAAVMWAPPVVQQIFGRNGNIALLWRYLRTARPDSSLSDGVRQMLTQLGTLPAYLAGQHPVVRSGYPMPPQLPLWWGLIGVALFIVAVVVSARTRRRPLLNLAFLSVVVTAAGVLAVAHVTGPLFGYLIQWTPVAGVLWWMTIGTALVGEALSRSRRRWRSFPSGTARVLVGMCVVAWLTGTGVLDTIDTTRVTPGAMAEGPPLATAIARWLGDGENATSVVVDPAPGPMVGGFATDRSLGITPGVIVGLRKAGIDAKASTWFGPEYPNWLKEDPRKARYRFLIAPLAHRPDGDSQLVGSVNGYGAFAQLDT